jgi:TRAP-type C4-dicarboxylate transport system permease small subunit
MGLLGRIHQILEHISRIAVWAGGAALLLAAIMVTIDVFMRKFFSMTMSGSDEVSGYVFAIATTWAYSYCLLHRSNVRIDAFYNLLAPRLRAVLDILGMVLLLFYMAYLTNKAWDVFFTSWQRNSVSITTLSTPLWIPQLLWVLGLSLFVFTLSFLLLYTIVSLIKGDIAQVQRIAGALSVEDEIAEETHGIDGVRMKGR